MKAMILAAGRGERMRPLTDSTPKPLLDAGGHSLLHHHIARLKAAGYDELVINTHHLAPQIQAAVGDGAAFGVSIRISDEQPEALETGGGILNALPLLGEDPFLVLNGDIWCDHPLTPPKLPESTLAHLILIPNPPHHPQGDFTLVGNRLSNAESGRLTFSGIGWYRAALFKTCEPGRFPLAPLLREAIVRGQVSGERFDGYWLDVGTPERLETLRRRLAADVINETVMESS